MVKLPQAYVLATEGLPDKAFSDQKCTKCRLAAGLHPDPLGSLQRSLRPPGCIETPHAFPRSSALRLTPLAFGDRVIRFFLFSHSNTAVQDQSMMMEKSWVMMKVSMEKIGQLDKVRCE